MTRNFARAIVAALLLVLSVAVAGTATPASAAVSAPAYKLCIRAHVADIGWQPWQCRSWPNYDVVRIGTTGQNRAIEAVEVTTAGFDACVQAHVRNIGWQSAQCTKSRVTSTPARAGTTGQGLPIEALSFSLRSDALVPGATDRRITAVGHVQNIGWILPWPGLSTAVTVGTTGRALSLESIMLQFS